MNKSKFQVIWIIIFVTVSIATFWFHNRAIPFYADDYAWINQLDHYSIWDDIIQRFRTLDFQPTTCGRLTCHLAVQFLLPFGELFFDIVNTIMFATVVWLIAKLCFSSLNRKKILPWILIVLSQLYICPNSATLFYWGSGSANYLFPLLLILTYIFALRYCQNLSTSLTCLLFVYSIAVGWTHEMFVLPMVCAFVAYLPTVWKSLCWKHYALVLGFTIGAFSLVFSPGSLDRLLSQENNSAGFTPIAISHILQGFKMFRDGRWTYILLLVIAYTYLTKNSKFKKLLANNWFYVLSFIASFCMIFILGHGGRAIWGIEVFSCIIIFKIIDSYIDKLSKWHNILIACFSVVIMIHQICLIKPYYDSWNTYRTAEYRVRELGSKETIRIEDWHSDKPWIDNFVAHPYQLMMHDMWMRIPNCHSFCDANTYDKLLVSEIRDNEIRQFGKVWIAKDSPSLRESINDSSLVYELTPISTNDEGSYLSLLWHSILQNYLPNRYPTSVTVSNSDIMPLRINEKDYLLFNQPFCPIWRNINNISFMP